MSYKERESDALRTLASNLAHRIEAIPIYRSDVAQAIVGINFWVESVIERLNALELASEQPLVSVEQAAVENLQKQTPETAELTV
jgi:hypothetical protein